MSFYLSFISEYILILSTVQMSLNNNASNQYMPNNLLIGQTTASPLCKVVNTIVSALHDTECDGSSTYCQCTLSLQ